MSYDLIIRDGTVVDGSGLPRYRAVVVFAKRGGSRHVEKYISAHRQNHGSFASSEKDRRGLKLLRMRSTSDATTQALDVAPRVDRNRAAGVALLAAIHKSARDRRLRR